MEGEAEEAEVEMEAGSNLGWHEQKNRRETRYIARMPETRFPLEITAWRVPKLPKWENHVKNQDFSPIVFIA